MVEHKSNVKKLILCFFGLCAQAIVQTSSLLPIEAELKTIDSSCIVFLDLDAILVAKEPMLRDKKMVRRTLNKIEDKEKRKALWNKLMMQPVELIDNKWSIIIKTLLDKEICIVLFEHRASNRSIPDIKPTSKIVIRKIDDIKIGEKYKKVIMVSINKKLLEQMETLGKKVVAIEYTYLNNLPKVEQKDVGKYIEKNS